MEEASTILEVKTKINNKTIRFSGAPWYKPGLDIIIGGVGGIGSWASFFLARQEANVYLFDDDTIEEVNLGGQLFSIEDIGKTKTDAMSDFLWKYTDSKKVDECGRYEKDSFSTNIVFSCFDNMAARKLMFENWVEANKDNQTDICIFVDGRLLAEVGQVYFVTRDKIKEYRETLFDDSEVSLEDCSYKSTTHCSAIIAGLMVSGFNNYINNYLAGCDVREVPFSLSYELPLLTFNSKS